MAVKMLFPCFIILFLFSVINGDQVKNILEKEKEILDNMLNSTTYDFRVRPMEKNNVMSPTRVKVNMYILMISRIDEIRMQYNAQLYLRQKWYDNRLKYDNLGGKLKHLNLFDEKVWTPDLFVSNERGGYINSILKPNKFVRIYPYGGVMSSTRVSLVLSCPMDFRFFPFDTQVCSISLGSYGFTIDDVLYEWDDEGSPVRMPYGVVFSHFAMLKHETSFRQVSSETGKYVTLDVKFHLQRKVLHHVIHLFMPSVILVVVSWAAFWLDHQIVMTRLFVVFTTLLVASLRFSDFNASLTPVSYTRSVDIWTGTCLTLIFAALLEVVVVDYRWRQQQKRQRQARGVVDTPDEENVDLKPLVSASSSVATDINLRTQSAQDGRLRNYYHRLVSTLPTGPEKLDHISRYLFPLSFLLFNVFYWLVNLVFYAL